MSPSENHLRAALRDGEGDPLDPGLVVVRAEAYRRARRGRIASMTAAAVTVAVVGVGGGLLLTNGSDNRSSADKAASAGGGKNALGSGSEYAASAPVAGNDAQGSAAIAPACPDSVPEVPLVASPTTRTTFYSATLASARVCSYSDAAKAAQRSIALTGANAASLGRSMTATQPGAVPCPTTTAAESPTFVVIAVYASGDEPLPIIAHWNTCGIVTNGPVTRSGWHPPASVEAFIAGIATPAPTS
jgi:hypothetical protein